MKRSLQSTVDRRQILRALLLAMIVAIGAGCVDAPKVLQGTVVSHDPGTHRLVVKDERPPSAEVQVSIDGADVGALPETGDLVRIAYREREGQLRATRVANLSRQSEMLGKKGGGGAH